MKKLLLTLSIGLLAAGHGIAQNDTLLWADFETDPSAYIINNLPPGITSDTSWYNWDGDGQGDGSGGGRPLEWFWTAGYATVDSTNGVLGSSSWTNSSSPTENWLITKSVFISDTMADLSWKSAPYQTPRYLDGYFVLVSTTNNDFSGFTDTLFRAAEYVSLNNPSLPNDYSSYTFTTGFVHGQDGTYTEFDPTSDSSRLLGVLRPHTLSLSQYAGQNIFVAFVHKSVDDNLISVDDILITGTNSVGIKETTADVKINAYPNPASDKLNLDLNMMQASDVTISMFDLAGRKVYSEKLGRLSQGEHKRALDITGMAAGMYQVQIATAGGVVNVKLEVKK